VGIVCAGTLVRSQKDLGAKHICKIIVGVMDQLGVKEKSRSSSGFSDKQGKSPLKE
jgi:hypothetical protein